MSAVFGYCQRLAIVMLLSRSIISITFVIALHCRKAAQFKRCFEAIDCTKSDDVYQIYSVFINLANEYMRQCENVTLPGCTDLTFFLKFRTDFDLVTLDVPRTFKVNGS